ncbi:Dioxygenase str8 [Paramyrothecium foliicola]|nr:Dioxygenase str8 [Paramyrothecium foliicola]
MASFLATRRCLFCTARAVTSRPAIRFNAPRIRAYSRFATEEPRTSQPGSHTYDEPANGITNKHGRLQWVEFSPSKARKPVRVAWSPSKPSSVIWLQSERHVPLIAATLRDDCKCSKCRDPASGQKRYASIEVDPQTKISRVSAAEDGLTVQFDRGIPSLKESTHETIVPWDTLLETMGMLPGFKKTNPNVVTYKRRVGVDHWDAATLPTRIQHIDFEAFRGKGDEYWKAMSDLVSLGIVFLKNVPLDPDSIVHVTETIGNLQETFYGRTFDVRAKPNAENVAYTSEYLGLHQDLLYLETTPQIQLLHCMENSCAGGESLFSDGGRVMELLLPYTQPGEPLRPLVEVQVPYGYHKHGHNYHKRHPVLWQHQLKEKSALWWSPPFQDAFAWPSYDIRKWIGAARLLESLINDENAVFTHRLQPGECVIFDNRRVLHGRRAFDATGGGSRWLRGAYIAPDVFTSAASQIPYEFAEKRRRNEELLVDVNPKGSEAWRAWTESMVDDLRLEQEDIRDEQFPGEFQQSGRASTSQSEGRHRSRGRGRDDRW